MNEKVTKFYEAVSADSALRDELQAVTDGIELHVEVEGRDDLAKAIADFATAHGFDLAADDLIVEPVSEGELSEDELAVVAGGWVHDYGFGVEECDCPTTGSGIFTPKIEPGQCAPWGRS